MAGAASPESYKDVVLFLATAGVVVPLFKRLKISPVLGFLGAGVVLGPHVLGSLASVAPWLSYVTVGKPEELGALGELGVVFLLFMVGLELSWERLRLLRRAVFGLGAGQVVIGMVAIGGVALMFGQGLPAAFAIGAALTLSSTAVIVPSLIEQKRMHAEGGRASFAVLLFQDLAVAPLLITITLFGGAGADIGRTLLFTFAPAAIGMVVLVVAGRLLLRPMLKSVARAKSEELFMAAALLVVIGAGVVAALSGLSMALGAFVAGLLLAETEFRHEVEVIIEPFKGLLLGLFFVSLGIGLDLSLVVREPLFIFGIAAGLILLKLVSVFGLARLFGMKTPASAETALALAAAGEFAFVLLDQAMDQSLVDHAVGEAVLVAATLTMFVIPMMAALGARLGAGAPAEPSPAMLPPEEAAEGPARVLVIGYGRVGKLVGEMMTGHEIEWVGIDQDARSVEQARRDGATVYFGDASRAEFLKRCGLENARALVATMDSPEAAEAVVATARSLRPDLTIVARARDARHAQRLYELGATDAVPETVEASLQLSEAALVDIGIPMGLVIASIHEKRDEFRKALNRPDALGGRRRRLRDAAR
ncbi:MAG: cation:proton antiporter [Caulobacteraceae bacterium]